jgi:hypothetical protein
MRNAGCQTEAAVDRLRVIASETKGPRETVVMRSAPDPFAVVELVGQ